MNEEFFKDTYVATFLASYMAKHHDDHLNDYSPNKQSYQLIADAMYLAEAAWQQYKKSVLGE